MVSAIDPTKPVDGVPAVKADMRANFLAAKNEIEALQTSTGGAFATEGEARAGTAADKMMSPLGASQHAESREAIASTVFDPESVLIDDNRQYTDTYNQSGAVAFNKAGAGTFRRGKTVQVTFNSDASALSWAADFEPLALGATLPAMLPAGLHTLIFSWHSGRSKIQVAWVGTLTEGLVFKNYSEVSPSTTGVSGSASVSFTNGNVQILTLSGNVTALAINDAPPAGETGTMTLIVIAGGFTMAHPTGTRHADGTPPTLSGRTYFTYITSNAGANWDLISGGKAFA